MNAHERHLAADNIGLVTPKRFHCDTPLKLTSGRELPSFELVYETYGVLNNKGSNAVLICHALSGSHHAAGFHAPEDKKAGWWDGFIGPGKVIDTNKFFVVCPNNIGSCYGSTGPTSLKPQPPITEADDTDAKAKVKTKEWGADFPLITIKDWVASQKRLMDHLGINQWAAVVGGSMGGMQAMQWAIDYPEQLRHAAVIAAAPKLSAQNIAFNEVARQAIITDPEFFAGQYKDHDSAPKRGLSLARMLAHITYLSDEAMREKFGRDLRNEKIHFGYDVEFQVESYLRYQGQMFSQSFDANTYLILTKCLDYFDPASEYGDDLAKAFERSQCRFFVASFTTDWRFSPARSREIVDALMKVHKPVSYLEVQARQGHDSFLLNVPRYKKAFEGFMNMVDIL
ncbi:MAG: homoserine O-acetyltransferase [Pseudomonadota bacterium]|nr:homoserine O-acetyltransferase [Pseudomonadota bacterium]